MNAVPRFAGDVREREGGRGGERDTDRKAPKAVATHTNTHTHTQRPR